MVKTPPGSNYAFGLLTENESNNVIDDIFLTTTADLEAGKPVWKHIADSDDKVTAFDASGNEIFLITYKDAAHSKIVATDLAAPAMATARTVVPESDAIIRGLAAAKDALYVTRSLDSSSQIIRLAISNGVIAAPQVLALPYAGTVGTLDTNQTNDGAVFELESWTRPALWYKYDPETGSIRDTGLQKAVAADTSNLVAKEVSAVSYDGTMVPLSIIMKAGTKLDGNNPTILIGYGSYGDTIAPGFDASSLPWLNRGGITAIAHVRGGGWYGEDWHKAGTKLTKLNTILDFIACAHTSSTSITRRSIFWPGKAAAPAASPSAVPSPGGRTFSPWLSTATGTQIRSAPNSRPTALPISGNSGPFQPGTAFTGYTP